MNNLYEKAAKLELALLVVVAVLASFVSRWWLIPFAVGYADYYIGMRRPYLYTRLFARIFPARVNNLYTKPEGLEEEELGEEEELDEYYGPRVCSIRARVTKPFKTHFENYCREKGLSQQEGVLAALAFWMED